jgi:hypothetical protein
MNVSWKCLLMLSAGMACATALQAQQTCETGAGERSASTPTARFVDNGDGTLTDQASQLMWQRCAAGQSWQQGQGCSGAATRHSLEEARALAERVNGADGFFDDWRLPSVRELATVTERGCANPRVNLQLFPATPAAGFWTDSARAGGQDQTYVMDFGAGGVTASVPVDRHHVRLVRTGP